MRWLAAISLRWGVGRKTVFFGVSLYDLSTRKAPRHVYGCKTATRLINSGKQIALKHGVKKCFFTAHRLKKSKRMMR